jgi:hypothetical protein
MLGRRLLLALPLLIAIFGGCRGSAYREVYQQKLIREVRTLEDRLNEAEYQNQVLLDELGRSRDQVMIPPNSRGGFPSSSLPRQLAEPRPSPSANTLGPGREATPPARPTLPARPLDGQQPIRDPQSAPAGEPALVPPTMPIPPGRETVEFPDVDLGEPVPPAGRDATIELPPGQVPVPNLPPPAAVPQTLELPEPVGIRIDPAMSGGHRDDEPESRTGMQLLIQAIDQQGNPISLDQFEIEADLTVVLRDPSVDPADSELGRWEFAASELHAMTRPGPRGGLQVYLTWQDNKLPQQSKVIAQVRLVAEEMELEAEAELSTIEPEIADWTPRGGPTRR